MYTEGTLMSKSQNIALKHNFYCGKFSVQARYETIWNQLSNAMCKSFYKKSLEP